MVKFNKINVFLLTLALIASSFGFQANAASAPTLGDQTANVTGTHNAVLSIFVNPNGGTTELHFKYWTGTIFKERVYLGVTGISSVRIEVGLINLLEGSNYSYQIVAVNPYGTTTGNTGSFSTSGNSNSSGSTSSNSNNNSNNNSNGTGNNTSTSQSAPLVSTNGPTTISANSATISGTVNPNGNSTSFWFEFGTTQSLDQTTTTQVIGSGNTQTSVTGTLTNLENNKNYYYRVVAQNSYGRNSGLIWYFNTGTGQAGGTGQSGTNGQVLGAVSGSGSGGSNTGSVTGTNSTGSSGTATGKTGTSSTSRTATKTAINTNPRPSFISMEYSLDANGALVLVANNLKPKPGEEFSYTIITRNDTQTSFNETSLKVILPVEVDYVGANAEPLRISGTVVEFDLGTVAPFSQNATVITVRVKETVKPGTGMIFTSVLGYKDRIGTQLATTSYMTIKVGSGGSGISLSAFSLGSLASSTGAMVLFAVGLLVLMVLLTYKFVKIRNGKNGKNGKNKKSEEDIFSKGGIPSTFEPISDGSFSRR